MQRESLKFDPQIAALAMPSEKNGATALGETLMTVGSIFNNARDRGRKEVFEDSEESRQNQKHGLFMQKGSQDLAKGAQEMSHASAREGRDGQTHYANMREKGFDIEGMGSYMSAGGMSSGGCAGGTCGSAMMGVSSVGGSDSDIADVAPISGGCAGGNCGSAISDSSSSSTESPSANKFGMRWVGKLPESREKTAQEKLFDGMQENPEFGSWVQENTKKEAPLTTAQKDHQRAIADPDGFGKVYWAKQKINPDGTPKAEPAPKAKEYEPTEAMKAYKEDALSIPDAEREQWMKDNPFTGYRKNYNESKKMGSGMSGANIITEREDEIMSKLGVSDLKDYDFSSAIKENKISQGELNGFIRAASETTQAKNLEREMIRKTGGLKIIEGQARRFATYANSKNVDSNVAKKYIDDAKAYIPGLDYNPEELENEAFRRDFMNVTSTMLKLQSGLTVSDRERANFESSLGTLGKNKEANFAGLKQKLTDVASDYEGIKMIDPVYFNAKYGSTLRSLQGGIETIDKFLQGNTQPRQGKDVAEINIVNNSVSPSASPTIVETRTLKDGRKAAKYSDGTIRIMP